MEITLHAPEKSGNGYRVKSTMNNSVPVRWENNKWSSPEELAGEVQNLRTLVIQKLYEQRSGWFSTPPTKAQLLKLCIGWDLVSLPEPPEKTRSYTGSLVLDAVHISETGIKPIWKASIWQELSKISVPWTNASDDELEEVADTRQITAYVDGKPVQLNVWNHEHNERKFAAKERVKEARLKAQLARLTASREMSRFFEKYSIDDNESSFSDYDLTDDEAHSDWDGETEYEGESTT